MYKELSAQVLTVYIGDEDRWKSGLLFPALVEAIKNAGIAGVTVTRGIEGYGVNGQLHTARLELFFQGLPIIVQAVDTPEEIVKAVNIVREMVQEGLVTLHDVTAIKLTKKQG